MRELDIPDEPMQGLVEVGHDREFRGVWIATVYNINWPSAQGLDVAAAQAELLDIIETVEAINLNAIVFQIRPESDAVYASQLEPWSRFLSGTQGGDPGWDPLEFLLAEAHARNIEVHGWINPYRAAASAAAALAQPHIALQEPQHAHSYNGALWMDPGAVEVREHVVDVLLDWWSQQNPDRYIFAGNYLSKLGTAPEWSLDEMLLQVELPRKRRFHVHGCRGWSAKRVAAKRQPTRGSAGARAGGGGPGLGFARHGGGTGYGPA